MQLIHNTDPCDTYRCLLASQKGNTGVSYDDIIRKLPALQNPLSLFEQHQLAEHIKDRVRDGIVTRFSLCNFVILFPLICGMMTYASM